MMKPFLHISASKFIQQKKVSLVLMLIGVPAAIAEDRLLVRGKGVDLEYKVNEAALPLDAVELWYSADDGKSWIFYAKDEDRHSPVNFIAPGEGSFGLFIRLSNSTGWSSAAPEPGTNPQQRVFVDFTPPIVQLHAPRNTTVSGQRVMQLRWTAIDSQFGARPIQLAYRAGAGTDWSPVCPDPIANTGRFDWRIPDSLSGSIDLHIRVTDIAGWSTESEFQGVELSGHDGAQPRWEMPDPGSSENGVQEPLLPGSKRTRERVAQLFGEAVELRDRGENAAGVAKLREVVRLDPLMTDAFAEMGMMLYRAGDAERALKAFEIALKQRPGLRAGLLGTALIFKQRSDYGAAAERLRAILKYNPNDAEVWLNLGDVAVYRGDGVFARECYTRAAQINPEAKAIVNEAHKRLALMAESSRQYKVSGK